MRSLIIAVILLLFCGDILAQFDQNTKDFRCFNQSAYTAFDFLKTTRSYGNYETEEEWSKQLSSEDIEKKFLELDGGRQYVIIIAAEEGVDGTAIEVRDMMGTVFEYVFRINELDNNFINLFFTPGIDDVYQIYFRVVNSKKSHTCTYMAILKGDIDPEEGIEEEEE